MSDAGGAAQPVGRVTGRTATWWRTSSRFAVGARMTAGGEAGGGPGISWLAAVLRWALFAGLAGALGGLVAQRVTASA